MGDINLSAGQDMLFGAIGVDFDNDVRAGGGIFVTAGHDFHIDGNADMLANDPERDRTAASRSWSAATY